jgi:hypothetical protein
LGEKRANWMKSLQEYDHEITPTQIIRGQGLCKLVVDSVEEQEIQINTSTMNQHNENVSGVHKLLSLLGMRTLNFI